MTTTFLARSWTAACGLALAAALLLSACGGGGGSNDGAPNGGTDNPAGQPGPGPVTTPELLASADDAADGIYVQWQRASGTGPWTLERWREGEATPTVLATVAGPKGRWVDSGLAASTAYDYRLRDAAGALVVQRTAATGSATALRSDLGQALGDVQTLALGDQAAEVRAGAVTLRYAAGSFTGTSAARVQPRAHSLTDGVGEAWTIALEQVPLQPLTVALAYGADEDPDEVENQTLAARTPDGRWWALPATTHDRATRQLAVTLPEALLQPAATERRASAVRTSATAPGSAVTVDLVRFVALKMVPRQASVRVLGSVLLTPVATWEVKLNDCGPDGKDICVPMVGLVQRDYPVINSKPGFERRWTLEGSASPAAELGSLAVNASTPGAAGVVYRAPATVPTVNPVTVRFASLDTRRGRRAAVSAQVRITEDRWEGPMSLSNSVDGVGYFYTSDTHWTLEPTLSTDSVRIYRAHGRVTLHIPPLVGCTMTPSPDHVEIGVAAGLTELEVDEITGRYRLRFNATWQMAILPCWGVPMPTAAGVEFDQQGVVADGRIRGDQQEGTVFRIWNLARPE